ncbi:NADH-cytochrome b5 reductase 2-like [Ornithodoros turicata]|uniref:NADH-cytochrome b5 reductase 2-like n=1 Tax=Ornithodoros turicata TaxID=34597 RepID=UPI00313A3995
MYSWPGSVKGPFPGHSRLAVAVALGAVGVLLVLWALKRRQRGVEAGKLLLDHSQTYSVSLLERHEITHNTRLLRFALPHSEQTLGLQVGKHIYVHTKINGKLVVRPYTPVSLIDQKGSFDLIVKVYFKKNSLGYPDGGTMSQYLDSLRPGDRVQIQGPKGRMEYKGRGVFSFHNGLVIHEATSVGMIAAGTGVTPMLQLLRGIFHDEEDHTVVYMVFVNHSERDIIMKEELDDLQRSFPEQFRIFYVVTKRSSAWLYGSGRLNAGHLRGHLPPPGKETVILICGPPGFVKGACQPSLNKLCYNAGKVYVY